MTLKVIWVLWTRAPDVAVMVTVYCPVVVFEVVGVVPPVPPPLLASVLPEPHPEMPKTPAERMRARRAPQPRRRRGSVKRSIEARATPEPAA